MYYALFFLGTSKYLTNTFYLVVVEKYLYLRYTFPMNTKSSFLSEAMALKFDTVQGLSSEKLPRFGWGFSKTICCLNK